MVRHESISKARWLASQKKIAEYWHGEDVLERELNRIRRYYVPNLEKYAGKLSASARILDMGCGPVCAARFTGQAEKTYLDPLLDDFRRAYPGKLPRGAHVAAPYESIPEADASFDLILCIDALDHAMNPELALHEIERLLKPGGIFIMGLVVFPALIARLHRFLECFISPLHDAARPYAYTLNGLRKTLTRHLEIIEEQELPEARESEARLLGREMIIVCRGRQRA